MRGLTQDKLKKLLEYNPDTGIFTWKVSSGRAKAGNVAGSVDCSGHRNMSVNKHRHQAHRLAWVYMTGEWPNEIDHINHVRDDNRWINLRDGTRSDNQKNASMRTDNKSGFLGVSWSNEVNKWRAQAMVNHKVKSLGYFDDKFEAICARASANNKYGYHENHGRNTCA